MSSAILTLLVSHILTFVENELLKEAPHLIEVLVQDIQSLITKLETLIQSKSSNAAKIADPILNAVSNVATIAIEAAGTAIEANSTPQSVE